jgi:hypothetical protein
MLTIRIRTLPKNIVTKILRMSFVPVYLTIPVYVLPTKKEIILIIKTEKIAKGIASISFSGITKLNLK